MVARLAPLLFAAALLACSSTPKPADNSAPVADGPPAQHGADDESGGDDEDVPPASPEGMPYDPDDVATADDYDFAVGRTAWERAKPASYAAITDENKRCIIAGAWEGVPLATAQKECDSARVDGNPCSPALDDKTGEPCTAASKCREHSECGLGGSCLYCTCWTPPDSALPTP